MLPTAKFQSKHMILKSKLYNHILKFYGHYEVFINCSSPKKQIIILKVLRYLK